MVAFSDFSTTRESQQKHGVKANRLKYGPSGVKPTPRSPDLASVWLLAGFLRFQQPVESCEKHILEAKLLKYGLLRRNRPRGVQVLPDSSLMLYVSRQLAANREKHCEPNKVETKDL